MPGVGGPDGMEADLLWLIESESAVCGYGQIDLSLRERWTYIYLGWSARGGKL